MSQMNMLKLRMMILSQFNYRIGRLAMLLTTYSHFPIMLYNPIKHAESTPTRTILSGAGLVMVAERQFGIIPGILHI